MTPDEHSHCWHHASGAVFAIANPPRAQRCCHCGWYRRVVWDPSAPTGHGRFVDNPGAYIPGEPYEPNR